MAKKNSSKTATEKSIQASEPRVLTFNGWKGVNFVDSPLTWEPLQSGPDTFRQTDLPDNFLMVQNNVNTSDTLGLETRYDSTIIGTSISTPSYVYKFTGVSTVYRRWLFCVARSNGSDWHEVILYRDITDTSSTDDWSYLRIRKGNASNPTKCSIKEIGFFEGQIVATARDETSSNPDDHTGMLMLAKATVTQDGTGISFKCFNWQDGSDVETLDGYICDTPYIANPTLALEATAKGMPYSSEATDETPVRVELCFCYTNRLGSTLTNYSVNTTQTVTIYTECSPALWTTSKYVIVRPAENDHVDPNIIPGSSIRGIDIYARDTENIDWVFAGHINVKPSTGGVAWSYIWYGNMTDISQWVTSQLMVPTENTTSGPNATHFSHHDSRIFYWGVPEKPYRLYIGGNPGAEFSIARGLGGAWVDIEPGSGYDIKGTAKWKTTSGANIVTIMCGNRNTTKVKRFNLVETNLTITNEVAYKSYMYEEVSNVVGCNSRWGYGVYSDGLYSLSRYGLMLTTMAMEYNAQMKNECVSQVVAPIFTERIGKRISNGRMCCINEVIYIALAEEEEPESGDPVQLDNVILCYDIGKQAWYTWTHDQTLNEEMREDPDHVLHILPIDSDEHIEGLGVITETQVRLFPVTGVQAERVPDFQVLVETGEIMPRQPVQAFWYIQQLELRFDYFIGDAEDPATVLIEGVDYYGRQFAIEKKLNYTARTKLYHNDQVIDEEERRSHVEWIRIDKIVESMRIRIKGRARFRLTHINAKVYQQADTIGTPYGFDAHDTFRNRHGGNTQIHHYINDYNNLRRAVVT